ncbi:Zinc finger BED domain-containing protein 5 [Merluccius polli]|uniref:Zinc finger BED domain-containing protein 5 n=1 Tax=Merluccius polli TaxID=89951 RepID=A0AA47N2L2_MERPO|nr:Zinc finger BED domain-containing protein 5 [Merluccius polli]
MTKFIMKLCVSFMKLLALQGQQVNDILYKDPLNQLPGEKLNVGFTTRATLNRLLEAGDITPQEVQLFQQAALAFLVRAVEYIINKLPLKDAKFVDVQQRAECGVEDALYFVDMQGQLDEGNTDSFENLHEFVDTNDYDAISVIPHIKQHISSLMGFFKKYFPENSSQYDWVRDPFSAPAPTGFSSAEEDQFIDMTSDSTLRLSFTSQTLSAFWLSVERQYPLLGEKAISILLPFATSYLCEIGFSAVAALKTKYRSQLNIEQELREQDKVSEEFLEYQLMDIPMPQDPTTFNVEEFWGSMSSIKSKTLRGFSPWFDKTKTRNSLALDGTLSSIMTVKMAGLEPVFQMGATNPCAKGLKISHQQLQ